MPRPDGQSLAVMSINSLRYPHYQQANWHPLKDFTYICGLSGYTLGIVVRADFAMEDVSRDMITAGKKDPDQGQFRHLGRRRHRPAHDDRGSSRSPARSFTHVPYKGGAEWMQALMGGEIQFVADAAQWAPFVDDGKCRILAFATEQRIERYKDVSDHDRAAAST